MKTYTSWLIAIIVLLSLTSCSRDPLDGKQLEAPKSAAMASTKAEQVPKTRYIPKVALVSKSQDGFSIPSPVEAEKSGEKYVTVFWGILGADTWGVENINGNGIWPTAVERNGAEPLMGLAFVDSLNDWLDFTLQIIVVGRKKDILNSKIVSFDRDGGKVHDPMGKGYAYDPKKFDDEEGYMHETFQRYGKTLVEQQKFWQEYAEARGIPASTFETREYRVGSPEWEEFKANLAKRLKYNYVMANGEIRATCMPLKEFQNESYTNHGVTPGQRFARNINLGPAPDLGIASSIISGVLDASNGPIQGIYARAECLREDLKPSFRLFQEMAKIILKNRDRAIQQLQMKLLEAQQNAPGR